MEYTLELAVATAGYTLADKETIKSFGIRSDSEGRIMNSRYDGYVEVLKERYSIDGRNVIVNEQPFREYENFNGSIAEFFNSLLPSYPIILDYYSVDYIIRETNNYITAWLEPHKITVCYIEGVKFYDYVEGTTVFGTLSPSYVKELVVRNIPNEIIKYPPQYIHGAIVQSPL